MPNNTDLVLYVLVVALGLAGGGFFGWRASFCSRSCRSICLRPHSFTAISNDGSQPAYFFHVQGTGMDRRLSGGIADDSLVAVQLLAEAVAVRCTQHRRRPDFFPLEKPAGHSQPGGPVGHRC